MSTSDPHRFYQNLEAIFAAHPKSTWQLKAWEALSKKGPIHKKTEGFAYFPLTKWYEKTLIMPKQVPSDEEIALHVLEEAKDSYIVFIGGKLSLERSRIPQDLEVLSLDEGVQRYSFFLHPKLSRWLKEEKDPLALLNFALHDKGAFLYLPPGKKLQKPLQILHYADGQDHYNPSLLYLFGSSHSSMHLISTAIGKGVFHPAVDLTLEEGAHISYTECVTKAEGFFLNDLRATVKTGGKFTYLTALKGPIYARSHLNIDLTQEKAEAELQGVWSLLNDARCHLFVDMKHHQVGTHSLQKFKGVLNDFSKSSFEGKIYVDPIAQKTQAYQVNHNLLLSQGCIANACPNLTIFADDVKASHGATIAQIDEESLFYLQSRGLSSSEAKQLLVKSFIQEILDQIPYPSLCDDFYL